MLALCAGVQGVRAKKRRFRPPPRESGSALRVHISICSFISAFIAPRSATIAAPVTHASS